MWQVSGFLAFLNIKNFRQIIHLRQHLLVVLLSGKCTTETATAFASFSSNDKAPCCSEEKSVSVKEVKVAGVNNKIIMPVDEAAEVTTTEKPCCSTSTPDCVKQN